jgi:hypothetical protein
VTEKTNIPEEVARRIREAQTPRYRLATGLAQPVELLVDALTADEQSG